MSFPNSGSRVRVPSPAQTTISGSPNLSGPTPPNVGVAACLASLCEHRQVTSTKETCLGEMRASFDEVMAVLDRIPRERLTEVGVTDVWSVRDMLAHEAGYERYVAAALF